MHSYLKSSAVAAALVALPVLCHAAQLELRAVNSLPLARPGQTIELAASALAPLAVKNLNLVHVRDAAGHDLLCQAIDTDGDALRAFDAVIFQADFAAGETRTFTVTTGAKQVFAKEQYHAFGRFVRERFDDFAWENDRIAHRAYGPALETWQGEPLTSSTIDVWSKRTPRMVINDWYLANDYHADHGEGADFYSAGVTRGCGGSGLWAADRLWVSRNFTRSNVLANGPLRVLFELEYAPFAVNGVMVAETKRIALDAGQQFNRIESHYQVVAAPGPPVTLTAAIGLRTVAGEFLESNAQQGWLVTWAKMEHNAGQQGLAVITRPHDFSGLARDALNQLVLAKVDAGNVATYWAGFGWDKAGLFTTAQAWQQHVSEFAQGLASPIEVKLSVTQ